MTTPHDDLDLSPSPSVDVYMLDVGQGDCAFIATPEGRWFMVDCADDYVAKRFIADHAIQALEAVIFTHLDEDHIGGGESLLRWFLDERSGAVERVVMGRDQRINPNHSGGTRVARELAGYLGHLRSAKRIQRRDSLRDDRGGAVANGLGYSWSIRTVLPSNDLLDRLAAAPRTTINSLAEPNRRSAAVRVCFGYNALLIGGDAPLEAWDWLRQAQPHDLRSRVFRAPHHGGYLGTDDVIGYDTMYRASRAEHIVVSVGHNTYRSPHPLPDHIDAMRSGGARVCCTQMTDRCEPNRAARRAAALGLASGVVAPYRHRNPDSPRPNETPCAGTVLVSMYADGTVALEPDPETHDRLIDTLATPLCRRPRAGAQPNPSTGRLTP